MAEVFRSCLQTLVYTSVLNKEVVLDNGLKIDLTSLDGSTSFYWAVVNRSNACVPDLHLDDLGVEHGMERIVQHLVLKVCKFNMFRCYECEGEILSGSLFCYLPPCLVISTRIQN